MSFTYSSDEASASTNQISQQSTTSNTNGTVAKSIESKYNKPEFQLEADTSSSIYIFKYGLFTRTLLPIDPQKEREIIVQCTT